MDEIKDTRRMLKRGRPRMTNQPQVQIAVYLDMNMLNAMDDAVIKAGIPRSEWIREAIKKKLES